MRVIRSLEVRHGQSIKELFGIEPSALTRDESQYLIGFRTTDELRNRAVKASADRSERIASKALPERQASVTLPADDNPHGVDGGETPLFSRSASTSEPDKGDSSAGSTVAVELLYDGRRRSGLIVRQLGHDEAIAMPR